MAMTSTPIPKTEIAVRFYNVTEMAAATRHCKKLEQEARQYSNGRLSNDEIEAAIGLLMLSIRPVSQLHKNQVPEITPPNRPIISSASKEYPLIKKRFKASQHGRHSLPGDKYALKSDAHNNKNTSSKSLLTSCRNILKEFLSQNHL